MTSFFDKIFTRYPIKTRRALELLPGLTAWTLILSPIWGSLLIPSFMAYFILFFDVYWLYKSFSLVITAYSASRKIRLAERTNWLEKVTPLAHFGKTNHILVFPNYKESMHKLRESVASVVNQSFPTKQIYIVLAMEEREEEAKEKADTLIAEFKHVFGGIFATYHPDVPGEVKGKSSNDAYAARVVNEKLIESKKIDIEFATISSVDADSIFDKQYFSYLTYKFLTDERRYNKFWQSANVNYSNFWHVPAPIRVMAFFSSLWRTGVLVQGDRLVSNSTYSLSFKLLKDIGYWDTDVIPEDYRIFFKAFFLTRGKVETEPIYLKTS